MLSFPLAFPLQVAVADLGFSQGGLWFSKNFSSELVENFRQPAFINNSVSRAPAARGGLPMLQLRHYIT